MLAGIFLSKEFKFHSIYRVMFTMNKAVVKFSSVTYAMKAKIVVENNGGKAIIRKNTKMTSSDGCGYSLVVSGNISRWINLFDLNKIKYVSYELV